MSLSWVTSDERPDLLDRRQPLLEGWPPFMLEDPVANECWDLLYERHGGFQHFLLDADADNMVAEVNSVPVRVDLDALPDRGWDDVLERGTSASEAPNVVSAISVVIDPDRQGGGVSGLCLERMRDVASLHGYEHVVAPVRPNRKARYPLIAMERYVAWTTPDGLPFDPWLRVHTRVGARLIGVCPESMTIPGSVEEWESWAGMSFPDSGDYVVPGALALVAIDRETDVGTYVEPNVWMVHTI